MPLFILILSLLLIPLCAYAQKSPLSYTAIGEQKAQDNTKFLRIKKIQPQPQETEDITQKTRTILQDVWDSYHRITKTNAENSQIVPVSPPQKTNMLPLQMPKQTSVQTSEQKPQGLAGILYDYRKNKNKRGDLRSIQILKPKAPEEPPLDTSEH